MTRSSVRLIAATLLPSLLLAGCGRRTPAEEPIRPVRAMRVADFAGVSARTFPGRAAATQEVDLGFRVSGPLVALPVRVGDELEQGDLIASIDRRDFEVALRSAEGNLQRARANQVRAENDLQRNLDIRRRNASAITQATIDQSEEALQVAKADVAALEAAVDAARDALGDTELKAPFAGTIVATYVENFQNVREKQMIARLLDKRRIEFEVNVPESLISLVPYVEALRVTFDAFPDVEVPAEIEEVGAEASATTRTFPVTLIMDQPEGVTILPGMAGRATATARPPGDPDQLAIVVPATAVFSPTAGRESYVWVIDEASSTVRSRAVQVGRLTSRGYVINTGLAQGEMIATAGVRFLKDGQQVEPVIQ